MRGFTNRQKLCGIEPLDTHRAAWIAEALMQALHKTCSKYVAAWTIRPRSVKGKLCVKLCSSISSSSDGEVCTGSTISASSYYVEADIHTFVSFIKTFLILSPSVFLPQVSVFLEVVNSGHPQSAWIKWR